jgi:hypothetical protein
VISAHLFILGRVDGGSLAILDVASLFEEGELPPNEGIIVRVHLRSDERSTVIDVDTEFLDVLPSNGREISHPMVRIDEIRDLLLADPQLAHDLVLVLLLRISWLRRQLGWVAVRLQFQS